MERDLIHKFIAKIPTVLRYYFANNLNILFSIKQMVCGSQLSSWLIWYRLWKYSELKSSFIFERFHLNLCTSIFASVCKCVTFVVK